MQAKCIQILPIKNFYACCSTMRSIFDFRFNEDFLILKKCKNFLNALPIIKSILIKTCDNVKALNLVNMDDVKTSHPSNIFLFLFGKGVIAKYAFAFSGWRVTLFMFTKARYFRRNASFTQPGC